MLIRNLFGYNIVGLSPRKIYGNFKWFVATESRCFELRITLPVFLHPP